AVAGEDVRPEGLEKGRAAEHALELLDDLRLEQEGATGQGAGPGELFDGRVEAESQPDRARVVRLAHQAELPGRSTRKGVGRLRGGVHYWGTALANGTVVLCGTARA